MAQNQGLKQVASDEASPLTPPESSSPMNATEGFPTFALDALFDETNHVEPIQESSDSESDSEENNSSADQGF